MTALGRPRHKPDIVAEANGPDNRARVEFERTRLRNRILLTGVALRSDVEDGIVSATELAADGWESEPCTDNWRRPARTSATFLHEYRHIECGIEFVRDGNGDFVSRWYERQR